LVNTGVVLELSNLALDGNGFLIWQALRHRGSGTILQTAFRNISFNPSGPEYQGTAVVAFGGRVDIARCTFENIGRVGVLYFRPGVNGALFLENRYIRKGDGDFLDYGVEVGAGAQITVKGNVLEACRGLTRFGDISAAVLASTVFGAGTEVFSTQNDYLVNANGIVVGTEDVLDTSTVTANADSFNANTDYGLNTTGPTVFAENCWWGDVSGPLATTNPNGRGDAVTDNVVFTPFETGATDLSLTVTDSADPVQTGDTLIYSVQVTNSGSEDALGPVLSYTLPETWVPMALPAGCQNGTCALADLMAGASTTLTFEGTVDPLTSGTLTSFFSVSATTLDNDGSNNDRTETTALSQTVIPADVTVGEGTEVGSNVDLGSGSTVGNNTTVGDDSAIGDRSEVGDEVVIGDMVTTEKGTTVGTGSTIGSGTIIGQNSNLGSEVTIGANTIIGKKASIGEGTTIENDVIIEQNVTIGTGVFIGAGAVIGQGADIGDRAIVLPGAVVQGNQNVPADTTFPN